MRRTKLLCYSLQSGCLGWPAGFISACFYSSKILPTMHLASMIECFVWAPPCCCKYVVWYRLSCQGDDHGIVDKKMKKEHYFVSCPMVNVRERKGLHMYIYMFISTWLFAVENDAELSLNYSLSILCWWLGITMHHIVLLTAWQVGFLNLTLLSLQQT